MSGFAFGAAGSGTPARTLYDLCQEAFDRFGPIALWSIRELDGPPTKPHALAIAKAISKYAGMPGTYLGDEIRKLANALPDDPSPDFNPEPKTLDTIETVFPPSEERPDFDVPRFWSNTALTDPDTIIALVLQKPTTENLARTVIAYGPRRVLAGIRQMPDTTPADQARIDRAITWLRPILKGIAHAAHQLATEVHPNRS